MPEPDAAPSEPSGPAEELPATTRAAILSFAVVLSVLGLTGTAFSPYLLVEHPLLLVALAPDGRHLVLVASQVDLLPLLAVGVPRRILAVLATFGFASLYGTKALQFAERRLRFLRRPIDFLTRALARVGAPLLVVFPTHGLAALSGATGMPWRRFLLAVSIGQPPFITAHYFFGEAISGITTRFIAFLAEHVVESTLVCCSVVLLQQLVVRLRKRGAKLDA